jgi:hypothetical protein
MESKENRNNIFIPIAVWIIGGIFLYIGVTLFSWGLVIGAFLILSFIIYGQIQELKEYLKELNVDSIISPTVKIYFCIGILQALLTIAFCLTVFSLIPYSIIYNKEKDQLIAELIQPNKTGSVLMLVGTWVIVNSIHHIWYGFLAKEFSNFSISEVFSNFYRVIKILTGILILLLGMYVYNF